MDFLYTNSGKNVRTYKNVEEGDVVVVVQDFFLQLLLNAAVHLSNTSYRSKSKSKKTESLL